MKPIRLSTVWLSGCSGCHMSLLNLHQELLEVLERCELVYSPLLDIKEYPEGVDIALVEGAVANEGNQEMVRIIRQRTRIVVSMGDCAINGNVAALRNPYNREEIIQTSYDLPQNIQSVVQLLPKVMPLHQIIRVDAFIPGCPPAPALIRQHIEDQAGFIAPQR